jgi:hypothetical protein
MAKYVVTITELKEELLVNDNITLPDLPDVLNTLTERLTPCGALDVLGLYLVDDSHKTRLTALLDVNHLPFPTVEVEDRLAEVVHLHDRRRRPPNPD